jgi:hypothetical protein
MKKGYLGIVWMIFLFSCLNRHDPGSGMQTMKPTLKQAKNVTLTDLAIDHKYIQLETNESFLVGSVSKIRFLKDRIFLLDSKGAKALFIFDTSGNFIRKIRNHGRGPGQFQEPADFSINHHRDKLILYCSKLEKMLEYSIEGDFEEEWRPQLSLAKFQWLEKEAYAAFTNRKYNSHQGIGNNNYDLLVFTKPSDLVFKAFPNDVTLNSGKLTFSFGYNFTNSATDVFYYKTFLDTIYKITMNSAKPAFYADFGSNTIPEHEKGDVRALLSSMNNGSYGCIVSFFTSDKLNILTYIEAAKSGILISDRSGSWTANIAEIENDVDNGIARTPDCILDNRMVFINYPEELYLDLEQATNQMPYLKGIEKNVGMYDNPVIMVVTLNMEFLKTIS